MSGIYLQLLDHPGNDVQSNSPQNNILQMTTYLRSDVTEEVIHGALRGGVIHHGLIRSSGVHKYPGGRHILMVLGACWFNDYDSKLVSIEEIANHIDMKNLRDISTLKGHYLFAFYDAAEQKLICESGPFGFYPLYYRLLPTGFVAASEIKSLLEFADNKINLDSIAELMHYGGIITPSTFIDGINKIPANHRLIYEKGRIRLEKLEKFCFSRDRKINSQTYAQLTEIFELSVKRYHSDTSDLSVSLSGGIDSRLSAIVAKKNNFNVRAITTGEPGSLDCRIASDLAAEIDIPLYTHSIIGNNFLNWFQKSVWTTEGRCPIQHCHYFDGLYSGNYFPEPQLHGVAGEAVIGGYHEIPELMSANSDTIRKHCVELVHGNIYWPHDTLHASLSRKLIDIIRSKDKDVTDYVMEKIDFCGSYSDFINFGLTLKLYSAISFLSSQVTPWTDIIAPFLDPTFFAFCSTLEPDELFNRNAQVKWGIQCYDKFSNIPRIKDGILIPLDSYDPNAYSRGGKLLKRKRRLKYLLCSLSMGRLNLPQVESFPAYSQWYRKWPEIRYYFDSVLLSERCLDRGIWKRRGIQMLMRDLRIGRNIWPTLGNILLCETFLRQFVDGIERPENILPPSKL